MSTFNTDRAARAARALQGDRDRSREAALTNLHRLAEHMIAIANAGLPAGVGAFRSTRYATDIYVAFKWPHPEDVPAIDAIAIDPDDDPCGYADAVFNCMPWTVHGADAPWTKWGGNSIIEVLVEAGAVETETGDVYVKVSVA